MDKKSQKGGNQTISRDEDMPEKTGYEASDIIEDALQLAVDDELKDREDLNNESGMSGLSSGVNINSSHNEVNSKKYTDDSASDQMSSKANLSPPKPETAPVVAPLTIEDKISMDTSKLRNTGTDEASMIVHLDDTNNDILEADTESMDNIGSNDNKMNRKSNNENNASDSKSVVNENKNSSNEDINVSTKDMNKISEKDSSKSKSSNQKENKVKSKESKNITISQKSQTNSKNNIWVSGLSQSTKACELQTIFSKHGKVVSAKIIKNARMSGSRCFGFITMENSEQVLKCIGQLNKSELHGRTISLSRNRPLESASKLPVVRSKLNIIKRDVNKNTTKESEETKSEDKSDENKAKSSEERHTKSVSESDSSKGIEFKIERRKIIRAPIRDRPLFPRRPMIPFKRPIPMNMRRPFNTANMRGFHRPGFGRGGIRPNFMMNRPDIIDRNIRERERERRIREERRRREEILRVDIEREERIRFEREKERLKLERMKLEREKAEFFKVERERARLEREKIEREREELRRKQQNQSIIQQQRVEESRSRSSIVTTIGKRPFESRDLRSNNESYWEDKKRLQNFQRIDSHFVPNRQNFVDSNSSISNRHSIPHSYDTRNDSYKRNSRIELSMTANSRTEFDARRHDSRHNIGHDRDERKSTGGPYYRGEASRNTFTPRDRRLANSQRDDWKSNHDSRRPDSYSDKPLTGGSNSRFAGNSRYGSDSRSWNDRSSNSVSKISYGSGIHLSSGQTWNQSMSGRWNSAISSSESRNRGQSSHSTSMLSGANPSISELFGSTPMSGIGLNISHSMAGSAANSLGSGDRPYLHNNRRF